MFSMDMYLFSIFCIVIIVGASIENDPCLLWTSKSCTFSFQSPFSDLIAKYKHDKEEIKLNIKELNCFTKSLIPRPLIASVALVDLALSLFALLFVNQNEHYQLGLLDQILKTIKLMQQHAIIIKKNSNSSNSNTSTSTQINVNSINESFSKRLNRIQLNSLITLRKILELKSKYKRLSSSLGEYISIIYPYGTVLTRSNNMALSYQLVNAIAGPSTKRPEQVHEHVTFCLPMQSTLFF